MTRRQTPCRTPRRGVLLGGSGRGRLGRGLLHVDRDGLGVDGIDEVADLEVLEDGGVLHLEVDRVLHTRQVDDVRLGVDGVDLRGDVHLAGGHDAGLLAGLGSLAALDDRARDRGLGGLLEADGERLGVLDDHLVALLDLGEVLHVGTGDEGDDAALRALEGDFAGLLVDGLDRGGDLGGFADDGGFLLGGSSSGGGGSGRGLLVLRDGGSGDEGGSEERELFHDFP